MAKNEARIKFTAETSELNKSLKSSQEQMALLRAEAGLNESQFKNTGDKIEYLQNKSKNLESQLKENENKQEALNAKLEAAKRIYGEDSSEVNKLSRQLTNAKTEEQKLQTAVNECTDELNHFGNEAEEAGNAVEQAANGGWSTGKQILADLAKDAIVSAGNALKDFAGSAVETSMEFDTSMSQVAATMGVPIESIGNMREAAKEAGATTSWTAKESADAMNFLALAGYSSEQAIATLPTVLNLATAGGMELADASDMVTDSMSALGIEADAEGKNITTFGDQMAKTASKSNTSVAQLGEAILTVGGTAKGMAGGTTELNAALGILADNGIKGAEGGTHLRNILLAMNPTTDKACQAWEMLGISAYDANGNLRSLEDVFADINSATADMTSEEKQDILTKMFNKTDLSSVQAMLSTSADRWNDLGGAIEDSGGAMQEMADTQLNNLQGDLTLMDSAMDGLKTEIGEDLTPVIRDVIQYVTSDVIPAMQAVWDWCTQNQGIIMAVAAVIGILTVAVIAYKVVQAVQIAMNAAEAASLWALVAAQAAVLAPYVLIVAAVAAVIAIIVVCVKHWDQIKAKVLEVANATWNAIKSAWGQLTAFASNIFNSVKTAIFNVFDSIKSKFADAASIGSSLVTGLWNGISGKVAWIKSKITGFCSGALGAIKSFFGINSPSRVMMEVGGFMADGLGIGFDDGYKDVSKKINGSLNGSLETSVNNSISATFDYKRMGKATAVACAGMDIKVSVGGKDFARAVRSVKK